jgi:hypothetical protein
VASLQSQEIGIAECGLKNALLIFRRRNIDRINRIFRIKKTRRYGMAECSF